MINIVESTFSYSCKCRYLDPCLQKMTPAMKHTWLLKGREHGILGVARYPPYTHCDSLEVLR